MNFRAPRLVLALICPLAALAQMAPEVIPLWSAGAPGFEKLRDQPEEAKDYWVRSVNNPSLTVYPAPRDKANGTAVLVVPGGGFRELVFNAEGRQAAEFLNGLGITAFALKYRLPRQEHSPYTMANVREDAVRAMRLIRSRSAAYGVDPARVGILGFSAGGVVVKMVAFDRGDGDPSAPDPVDRLNARPNFEIIVYPGKEESPAVVPADTGPAFLVAANDDEYGCDLAALDLFEKFRASKVLVEAHFIERGKHAFNMGDRSKYASVREWPHLMANWLGDNGLLKKP